ncbi:MAG: dipeptidase [Candidatus Bipolaricaulis sp.]|nr:dipeptidase [Candidatus Bipolaricaulis sp.]MDD5647091.1 dipeptidase [Candidatus Bipolaricaulis sp.]
MRDSSAAAESTSWPFFDAHCDAPMKVIDDGADFASESAPMHVTLPALAKAGVRVQVFASCAVYPDTPPDRVVERGLAMVDAIGQMAAASGGRMRVVHTARDVTEAMSGGPIGALVALEGADPLEGRAESLRTLVERGVRSVIFAWKDNEFSGTAFGTNRGLSREGERLLGLAEELSVMVDVSHLSDAAFDDVCARSSRPFVASHSNCRSICPHPRNLTDAMIRRLADRGGVMGINLAPHFLDAAHSAAMAALRRGTSPGPLSPAQKADLGARRAAIPLPSFDLMATHVLHAIRMGGEDVVGLGGDLDGIERLPAGIETVADYRKFVPLLRSGGLSGRQIEKVCFRNFARVFSEVLP